MAIHQNAPENPNVPPVSQMSNEETNDQEEPRSPHDMIRTRVDRIAICLRQLQTDLAEIYMLLGNQDVKDPEHPPVDLSQLTPREIEIVRNLVQGRRVPQIAQSLYLSSSTVRSHLKSVFRKLGVHSQGELIELLRATASPYPSLELPNA